MDSRWHCMWNGRRFGSIFSSSSHGRINGVSGKMRRSCKDFVFRIGRLSPVSHGTRLAIQSRGIHTHCEEGVKTSLCCCKDTQSPVKDFFERLPLVRFI